MAEWWDTVKNVLTSPKLGEGVLAFGAPKTYEAMTGKRKEIANDLVLGLASNFIASTGEKNPNVVYDYLKAMYPDVMKHADVGGIYKDITDSQTRFQNYDLSQYVNESEKQKTVDDVQWRMFMKGRAGTVGDVPFDYATHGYKYVLDKAREMGLKPVPGYAAGKPVINVRDTANFDAFIEKLTNDGVDMQLAMRLFDTEEITRGKGKGGGTGRGGLGGGRGSKEWLQVFKEINDEYDGTTDQRTSATDAYHQFRIGAIDASERDRLVNLSGVNPKQRSKNKVIGGGNTSSEFPTDDARINYVVKELFPSIVGSEKSLLIAAIKSGDWEAVKSQVGKDFETLRAALSGGEKLGKSDFDFKVKPKNTFGRIKVIHRASGQTGIWDTSRGIPPLDEYEIVSMP